LDWKPLDYHAVAVYAHLSILLCRKVYPDIPPARCKGLLVSRLHPHYQSNPRYNHTKILPTNRI